MASTLTNLLYHIVFSTKYRKRTLTTGLQSQTYQYIAGIIKNKGGQLLDIGGVEDHVHLLVRLPATLAPSLFVKHVKGSSAHLATHMVAPDRFFKWQGSYAAFSISSNDLDRLCAYITHQKEHHRRGTIIPEWEEELDASPSDS